MIKFIISLLILIKERLGGIENRLSVSIVTSDSGLERELKRLGEDVNRLECVGCKTKLKDVKEVRGVYRHKGETFVYCSKLDCEYEAMHKMLA